MNDVVATGLAIGLIYVVLKFAFGGPSSSTNQPFQEPVPLHEQERRATTAAAQQRAQTQASSSSKKKETLISKYGLEGRLDASEPVIDTPVEQVSGKGKGKAPTEDEWKKGADKRMDDLRRRRENMILDARRKLLEKQQNRAAVDGA